MVSFKSLKKYTSTLERWTRLDLKYFAKGGIYSTMQQIIGISSGLAVSYMFGHFVNKSVFGEYNLILSIISTFTFLSLPGMDTALLRSVGEGHDASLTQATKLKFRWSLLAIPVLLIFSSYYFIRGINSIAVSLLVAAFIFPFLNLFTIYSSFLTAKRMFGVHSSLASIASIFFLITLTFVILIFPTTLGITIGYLLAIIIPAVFAYFFSLQFVNKKYGTDPDLTNYGYFLTALTILPWISGNLGNIVLAHSLGIEALAIYAVASKFLTTVQKNFQVFYKPATAKLAGQTPKEHILTLKTHSLKLIIVGIGLTLILWNISPFLIRFFFTDAYQEAIVYAQRLSLALIPLPFTWVATDIVVYQKRKQPQLLMSTISPLVKIILYFFVVPKWGVNGLVFILLLERFTDPLIPLFVLLRSSHKN